MDIASRLSHLEWPFFEDSHRALGDAISAWSHRLTKGLFDEIGNIDLTCRNIVRELGEAGWLKYASAGRAFGAKHDGLEVRSISLIRENLAYAHELADFAFAMQGLGSAPIALFGNERQKARYLPGVIRGSLIPAFALSEPEAGSDAAALATEARPEGGFYVLNGLKTWVSNGGLADFYVVFARLPGTQGSKGICALIVEAETPGLEIVERIHVTAPHPLATIAFRGCAVPREQLIGGEGEGFKIAMKTLDAFRISVAAAAVGFARRALDESLGRVTKRKVFGLTLAELQLTQSKLAHMASLIDAAALLTYRAAWMKDCGKRTTKEAAMAKWFATEAAQRVVDEGVQLWGGLGVRRGYVVETLYRAVRPLRIYEGTSEIQQLIIAREILKAFLSSSDGRLSGQAEGREAERRKNDDGVHRP